ncbi:MAG: hypothetical protein LW878_08395 [Proteobacteria bacterium]|jgi:hypothetical protein|nr:hypothetical protein [Pseudomonadota bacterium]
MLKLNEGWRIYLKTLAWLGPFSLVSYLYTNWRTDQVIRSFDVYFDIELKLPLVASAAYFYCGLILFLLLPPLLLSPVKLRLFLRQLFIGCLVALAFFYIFPAPLAFIRSEPANAALELLYLVDRPNNASFSIFQFYLGLITLACFKELSTVKRSILVVLAVMVGLSGLLIWQQHLMGIMTAWSCAIVLRLTIRESADPV